MCYCKPIFIRCFCTPKCSHPVLLNLIINVLHRTHPHLTQNICSTLTNKFPRYFECFFGVQHQPYIVPTKSQIRSGKRRERKNRRITKKRATIINKYNNYKNHLIYLLETNINYS